MSIRDQRQLEFAKVFVEAQRNGILYLCPRFGKCRVGINIFAGMKNPRVLIAYPDANIKKAWLEEFEKTGYKDGEFTFTTHLSLKKYVNNEYDLLVLDEIHLLSDAQIEQVKILMRKGIRTLGLTGTLSQWTRLILRKDLNMEVLAKYAMETAIEEGVIADYEIHVKLVPLDNKVQQQFGSKRRTEKKHFDAYSWVINKKEIEGENIPMALRLNRMRTIQGSLGKLWATQHLLHKWKKERVLVFCGLTAIADKLGCPVYHSKAGEKSTFDDFAEGKGNHLAVVKIGNTGKTYKPLDKVIINYFDSNAENLAQKINRCMAMEYNNPNKKAIIYIICSTEDVERRWLQKALEFFEKDKIFFDK